MTFVDGVLGPALAACGVGAFRFGRDDEFYDPLVAFLPADNVAVWNDARDSVGLFNVFGVAEIGASEIGVAEIGASEIGASEIGASEIGVAEIGASEIGASEIGVAEIGASEIGVAEIGALAALLAVQPFSMCF